MIAPGWPRLATRLLSAQVSTLQGRWRTHEATGTFAYRSPEDFTTLDDAGNPSHRHDVRHTPRPTFERGDYCTAAGPVTQIRHDGRPAWRVELAPPPRKQGLLALTVDDATGLLVKKENAAGGYLAELYDLVVDGPVDEAVFSQQRQRDKEAADEAALYALANRRPVPTPRWFPWRRGWVESPELQVIEADRGTGSVGRAPAGQQAPVSEWINQEHVHRLDHRGWSWAVSSEVPMSRDDAQRVVEQVTDE